MKAKTGTTITKINRGDYHLHVRQFPGGGQELEIWDRSSKPGQMIKAVEEKVMIARLLLHDPDSQGYGRPITEHDLRGIEEKLSGLALLVAEGQIRGEGESATKDNVFPEEKPRKKRGPYKKRKKAAAGGVEGETQPSRKKKRGPGRPRKVGRPKGSVGRPRNTPPPLVEEVTDGTEATGEDGSPAGGSA